MPQITGTITNITSNPIKSAFGPLVAFSIEVDNEEETVILQKNQKPENALKFKEGDEVTALYETVVNGQYTNNKITQINLGTELEEIKPYVKGSYNAGKGSTAAAKGGAGDSNGARTGMLVKAGLDLAVARKTLDTESIKQAVRDMDEVAKALETGELSKSKSTVKRETTQQAAPAPSIIKKKKAPAAESACAENDYDRPFD